MAIIGGAGNPIGGSFTGPAQALEIYGDFGVAYTGLQQAATSPFTVLSFTTGNYLFVGEFQLNAAITTNDPGGIEQTMANIKLNDSEVSRITVGNSAIDAPMSQTQPMIIPAYTEVEVEFEMVGASVNTLATGTFTGKIYRE